MNYNTPQQVIVTLPSEARASAVQLGWWQITEMQSGAFAIDDILLGPSTYDFGTRYSDTYAVTYFCTIIVIIYNAIIIIALSLVVTQACGGRYLMELLCQILVVNRMLLCLELIWWTK